MKIMASGPITSCQIDGEALETVTDVISLGSKITVDGDCSHEIKRRLLLGRKAMTNLRLVAQSCPILCNPMGPPGPSVHRDSPGKNTGVGCHALLQGNFPTQGSNAGLLLCRQILYRLSHQGSPKSH